MKKISKFWNSLDVDGKVFVLCHTVGIVMLFGIIMTFKFILDYLVG